VRGRVEMGGREGKNRMGRRKGRGRGEVEGEKVFSLNDALFPFLFRVHQLP